MKILFAPSRHAITVRICCVGGMLGSFLYVWNLFSLAPLPTDTERQRETKHGTDLTGPGSSGHHWPRCGFPKHDCLQKGTVLSLKLHVLQYVELYACVCVCVYWRAGDYFDWLGTLEHYILSELPFDLVVNCLLISCRQVNALKQKEFGQQIHIQWGQDRRMKRHEYWSALDLNVNEFCYLWVLLRTLSHTWLFSFFEYTEFFALPSR